MTQGDLIEEVCRALFRQEFSDSPAILEHEDEEWLGYIDQATAATSLVLERAAKRIEAETVSGWANVRRPTEGVASAQRRYLAMIVRRLDLGETTRHGVTTMQDPKFDFQNGRAISRDSGPVPLDEPLFVFRARDRRAVEALIFYQSICHDPEHREAIALRIEDFERFARNHPDRMKEPDTSALSRARGEP